MLNTLELRLQDANLAAENGITARCMGKEKTVLPKRTHEQSKQSFLQGIFFSKKSVTKAKSEG